MVVVVMVVVVVVPLLLPLLPAASETPPWMQTETPMQHSTISISRWSTQMPWTSFSLATWTRTCSRRTHVIQKRSSTRLLLRH